MTRARTTAVIAAAALCAAALVFGAAVLPPAASTLAAPAWKPDGAVVRGAYHVHTVKSDGTGTPDEVASAAARAGLQFVVFTDHGDATRRPDPPSYRSGVLCVDAVEVSTEGGHYVAIGLGQAPYPLGGEPRDVVDDVARLGGVGFAAHPDSPKPGAGWDDWGAPIDGLEWLNADTAWRTAPAARLARASLTYLFRAPETLASLFRRPAMLAKWDALSQHRRVVAIAAADAHARIGWESEGEPHGEKATLARVPSYEAVFRAFSLHVTLDSRFEGRPIEDAARLVAALRRGHLHTVVDGFARNGAFEFTARSGASLAREGDSMAPGDAVILRARSNAPAASLIVLFRDGREINRVTASELIQATNRPGVYRAEARLAQDADAMPWAVSNSIAIGATDARAEERGGTVAAIAAAPAQTAGESPLSRAGGDAQRAAAIGAEQDWQIEHDPTSSGSVPRQGRVIGLEYRLGSGIGRSQFAALSHHGPFPATASALAFRIVGERPMRVSVQIRAELGSRLERWARSIYVDASPRDVLIPIADMRPVADTPAGPPALDHVTGFLFVVDRTNAPAGAVGRFGVENVEVLGRHP